MHETHYLMLIVMLYYV